VEIARNAVDLARRQFNDVLIVDTAGRLHIDEQMMEEIKLIHAAIDPAETLFVVDSMTGQDAANSAKAFNESLPLTGVILTKADGDARGGAALSVRHITGKPIKFIGMGEKVSALEPFHPDRIASRILGMGDVLSLVEEAHHKVDQKEAQRLAKKVRSGQGFSLEDLRGQLEQMASMGGMGNLLDKLPGIGAVPEAVKKQANDGEIKRMIAIINSMTLRERRLPHIIKGSHKRRIASGSGTRVQDVNRLLKQHIQMRKMMKKFSKGGMAKMMRGLKGRLPPGMPF
jgi:signal recognition particle subunit SRP54